MSKTPRIVAASASAALLAATGAGAAVFAVETIKDSPSSDKAAKADQTNKKSEALKAPKDEGTTIYRAPSESGSSGYTPPDNSYNPPSNTYQQPQPAPPSTTWKSGGSSSSGSGNSGKSHSS